MMLLSVVQCQTASHPRNPDWQWLQLSALYILSTSNDPESSPTQTSTLTKNDKILSRSIIVHLSWLLSIANKLQQQSSHSARTHSYLSVVVDCVVVCRVSCEYNNIIYSLLFCSVGWSSMDHDVAMAQMAQIFQCPVRGNVRRDDNRAVNDEYEQRLRSAVFHERVIKLASVTGWIVVRCVFLPYKSLRCME